MRNPLLDSSRPHHLPDFPAIRPEHIVPALENLLQAYRSGVEDRVAGAAAPHWSIVEAEVEWADAVARAWSPVSHLKAVADSKALREAYNVGLERLTEHQNWRQHHGGIYIRRISAAWTRFSRGSSTWNCAISTWRASTSIPRINRPTANGS
jgi:oligopeptidase A